MMSYAMGLGLRPAIAIRDMFQAFTGGLTVMGPSRFSKAFASFMMHPKEAFDLADSAGALLRKNNIGELYGDIKCAVLSTRRSLSSATNQASSMIDSRFSNHNRSTHGLTQASSTYRR